MTNAAHTIRRAVPTDAPCVAACVTAAYEQWIPIIGMKPAPMLQDYTDVLANDEVFVAESDGMIVGVLVLVYTDDYLLLENVAVHPSQRGQGIGRELITLAETRATAKKKEWIHLYTNERMASNIALYERFGYREFLRRKDGEFARVYMRKPMNQNAS